MPELEKGLVQSIKIGVCTAPVNVYGIQVYVGSSPASLDNKGVE